MTKKKLTQAVSQALAKKRDKIKTIPALLGAPINGQEQVEVAGRNGFVWVRLYDGLEIIQAYNSITASVYGLPVLVAKDEYTGVYTVVARNLARYNDWGRGRYQNKHGWQHSFAQKGRDTVFTYNRQMLPFLTAPVGPTGSTSAYIWGAHYNWGGQIHYAGDTTTDSLLALKPATSGSLFHTVFLDQNTATFGIVTGTTWYDETTTGTSAVVSRWPGVYDTEAHAAIAGIRLVSGTYNIDWDNIYNFTPYIAELTTTGTSVTPNLNKIIRRSLYGADDVFYDPDVTGLLLAVSELAEDDTLYIPQGSYNTDLTITQDYVKIVGAGNIRQGTGYTQIRGEIFVADEVTFENISLYHADTTTGTVYNVRPLGAYYTYFKDCDLQVIGVTGTVANVYAGANGGWIQAYSCTFAVTNAAQDGYFAYVDPAFTNFQVDLYDMLNWSSSVTNSDIFTNNQPIKTHRELCRVRYGDVHTNTQFGVNVVSPEHEIEVSGAFALRQIPVDPEITVTGTVIFWKPDGSDTGEYNDILYKELTYSGTTQGALNWKDFTPVTGTVNTGTPIDSPTASDVQYMFDGRTYNVQEVSGVPGYDIEFKFANVDRYPTMIVARWQYDGSDTHFVTIDIYNYRTVTWDELRVFNNSNAFFASMTMYLPLVNQKDYVAPSPAVGPADPPGTMRIRFYHQSSGDTSHDIHIDYVGVVHGLQGII